jgi:hypothetical protein
MSYLTIRKETSAEWSYSIRVCIVGNAVPVILKINARSLRDAMQKVLENAFELLGFEITPISIYEFQQTETQHKEIVCWFS